jgi:hypothetical protein
MLSTFPLYARQREFIAAGTDNPIRFFMAGNRTRKSSLLVHEALIHASGQYPADWPGMRFDHPVSIVMSGITREHIRDTQQYLVLGMLPPSMIGWRFRNREATGALDGLTIQHARGATSNLYFTSHLSSNEERWKGADLVVIDEANMRAYEKAREIEARHILLNLTPVGADGGLVDLFMGPDAPGPTFRATMADTGLYSEEEIREQMAMLPE